MVPEANCIYLIFVIYSLKSHLSPYEIKIGVLFFYLLALKSSTHIKVTKMNYTFKIHSISNLVKRDQKILMTRPVLHRFLSS